MINKARWTERYSPCLDDFDRLSLKIPRKFNCVTDHDDEQSKRTYGVLEDACGCTSPTSVVRLLFKLIARAEQIEGPSMITVDAIDHIHVEVSDRDAAAEWYQRILGLQRSSDLHFWANDPMGPLILSTPDGRPALSLFARPKNPVSRDTTIAFRVTGAQFINMIQQLPNGLTNSQGLLLDHTHVRDHQVSWSIYFQDPYENRLEITTYDYAPVEAELKKLNNNTP